jgi:hypothetical protein
MNIEAAEVKTETTYELTITLTELEATAFLAVLNNIRGLPSGPRGMFDEIGQELNALGIRAGVVAGDGVRFPPTWKEFKLTEKDYC